jgi:hypothetical protein
VLASEVLEAEAAVPHVRCADGLGSLRASNSKQSELKYRFVSKVTRFACRPWIESLDGIDVSSLFACFFMLAMSNDDDAYGDGDDCIPASNARCAGACRRTGGITQLPRPSTSSVRPSWLLNTLSRCIATSSTCRVMLSLRYLDESRQDSVDVHPRRFEPGICARNFLEDAQEGGAQHEEGGQAITVDEEGVEE